MEVVVSGKTVRLSKSNYLAEGGEGAIYVKGPTAFKIYTDPKKMIPDGKIQELQALTLPTIIKPEHPIFDRKSGKPCGYTMRYVKDTHPLCQVFTKAFKKRHGIKPRKALGLIDNMRSTLCHIHAANILVVDGNEMNFLVDDQFTEAYFIDVDSYQTPGYRATALMESVRDRHSKLNHFDQGTDWFAWGVVTFQIMSGIHPYKGKHPTLNGFEDRMLDNVSVFNPDVKVPKAVSDFDKLIPAALKEWYQKTFEDGLRCPPPVDFVNDTVGAQVFIVHTVTGTNNFIIDLIEEYAQDIVHYAYERGQECVITSTQALYGHSGIQVGPGAVVGFENGSPLVVWRTGDKLYIDRWVSGQSRVETDATDFMVCDGRIYYKYADYIMEVKFIGGRFTPLQVSTTMEHATKMFPGVSIQQALGRFRATYFPDSGTQYQIPLDLCTGKRIVDAKLDDGVLVLVTSKKGQYDMIIHSVHEDKIIHTRVVEDISYNGINMAVTDRGIAVMINVDENVEVFSVADVNKIKVIEDDAVHADMRLYAKGGKVVFAEGRKLHKLEMK